MKTVGIIGGLGTETSCSFCFNVNHQIKQQSGTQPHLIMDNLPVPKEVENNIAKGSHSEEMRVLLTESIIRLNEAPVDFIVIPCNTVHTFIQEMRSLSKVPVLSIIEETVKECQKRGVKKVGILASTTTIKEKLYAKELEKESISHITPNENDQQFVSECICKILNLQTNSDDRKRMLEIIEKFRHEGAQAVILGCTDLFLIIPNQESSLPVINSTTILEKSTVEWLVQKGANIEN